MEKVNNEKEGYPHCPKYFDIYGINLQYIKASKILECGNYLCKEWLQDLIKKENK